MCIFKEGLYNLHKKKKFQFQCKYFSYTYTSLQTPAPSKVYASFQ